MKTSHQALSLLFAGAALAAFCLFRAPAAQAVAGSFQLRSSDFGNNQSIPRDHTCDGGGTSPALRWTGAPKGTKSLALILFDPDARPPRGFVHWVLYDLPPAVTQVPSGKYDTAQFPLGGLEGNNGRGKLGFIPSCPGAGPQHHYTFTLYALNQPSLGLAAGADWEQVLAAMKGKIIAQTQLVGLYSRTTTVSVNLP